MRADHLGEKAIILRELGRCPAHRVARHFRSSGLPGLVDAVAAYHSVGLYFEGTPPEFETLQALMKTLDPSDAAAGKAHRVPVCYERGLDLNEAAVQLNLDVNEFISLHGSRTYDCYAVGFCPGFPYLGTLPDPLTGLARLPQPRVKVEPGSVGITGQQTGIYPLSTPGGWWLIGQTPLEIVNVRDGYFPIEAGDTVAFDRIDAAEFERLLGERL